MALPRFIQIHTLHSYTGVLLNRDDHGLAKRLPYGGEMRSRISSQCLKHHWRHGDGLYSFQNLAVEDSFRSRDIITKIASEAGADLADKTHLDLVTTVFQKLLYGKDGSNKKSRQPLLLGAPEIRMIRERFEAALDQVAGLDKKAAEAALAGIGDMKAIFSAVRDQSAMPGGIVPALFGRMVTSDRTANIDAPIHVAHSFTVHGHEIEGDYLVTLDDLANKRLTRDGIRSDGALDDDNVDHVGETEIGSGLYYGYVVIDLAGLVSNITGCERADLENADRTLPAEVAAHLLRSIAEISPGAKRGSTAPYGYAGTMLLEAGSRQPRSLSNAFRKAVRPSFEKAETALAEYLEAIDKQYATNEDRRYLSLRNQAEFPGAGRETLSGLQDWLRSTITAERG